MENKKKITAAAVALLTLITAASAVLLVRVSNGFFDFSVVSALAVPAAFSIAVCVRMAAKRPVRVVIIILLCAVIICVIVYLDFRVLIIRYIYNAYNYIIRNTDGPSPQPGYPSPNEILVSSIKYAVIVSVYATYLLVSTFGSRRAWLKRALVIVPYAMSMAGVYGLAAG